MPLFPAARGPLTGGGGAPSGPGCRLDTRTSRKGPELCHTRTLSRKLQARLPGSADRQTDETERTQAADGGGNGTSSSRGLPGDMGPGPPTFDFMRA